MKVDVTFSVSPLLHTKCIAGERKCCLINFICKWYKLRGLLTLAEGSYMFILILLLVGGFHLVISPFGGKHWLDGCLGTESREAVSAMVNGLCECWEVMSTDGLGIDRKQSVCMSLH